LWIESGNVVPQLVNLSGLTFGGFVALGRDVGEAFTHRSVDGKHMIGVKFEPQVTMNEALLHSVLVGIADKIADRYVAEHYQEVVALIKPEAVATLVAAESAAQINKTLKEDMPHRVRTVVKREIYQRGLLGGVKRIG
jgi:hypothetical protein